VYKVITAHTFTQSGHNLHRQLQQRWTRDFIKTFFKLLIPVNSSKATNLNFATITSPTDLRASMVTLECGGGGVVVVFTLVL
jgi:hypothetical protein